MGMKEHESYIAKVRTNQEEKLKPYVAELEVNINKKMEEAEKRRVEAQAKVVESAKKDDKINTARTKKEELAALEAAKAESELNEKLKKAEELREKQEQEM